MARQTSNKSVREKRTALYETVTQRIICELEQGRRPWLREYDKEDAQRRLNEHRGLPFNAKTGRTYRGFNTIVLWIDQMVNGRTSCAYLGFNQARLLGGTVRRGEKATQIIKYGTFVPQSERERVKEEGGAASPRGFVKSLAVFSVDQCDGIAQQISDPISSIQPPDTGILAALISAHGAKVLPGDSPAYVPQADAILMPPIESYVDFDTYQSTLFHELVHWTGHKSRHARDFGSTIGTISRTAAFEELVAELGAAFLCAICDVEPANRSADYLASYLDILRDDPRAIVDASSVAQQAVDLLIAPIQHSNGVSEDSDTSHDNVGHAARYEKEAV